MPVCGNGLVETGELCDGDCPSSCDDGNACTTDTLVGDAARCTAECTSVPVTECVKDDGCCAVGCNNTEDNDCEAVCGNGITEAGELCDGDCSSSCDDGNACTTDTLVGDAGSCTAECITVPATECVHDDGCCVGGCNNKEDNDCEAVCGNGITETGELCDGNCPSSCDDGDTCTTDVLTGSAAGCDVRCTNTPPDTCANGDGCCGSGCNANNDSECLPDCGNGVIETGELCDGDCPSSCDDGNACTTDTFVGDAESCNVECTTAPVTECLHDDDCCVAGCNNNEDNDCASVCGNGITETGELCDGDCPSSCDDGNACTTETLVGDAASCDAECTTTPVTECLHDDGCCASGCTSDGDADCLVACGTGGDDCTFVSLPSHALPYCDGSQCGWACDAVSQPHPASAPVACLLNDGQACVDNDECAGTCIGQTCAPLSPTGGFCDAHDDCQDGHRCDSFVCESTELCGLIEENTTLLAGPTWHVSCDLLVVPGVTLTVNAGAWLEFASGTKLVAGGVLEITGTESAPVVLTSDSATPAPGDWEGIQIRGEDLDSIEYASISYATTGIDVNDGNLELRNSEVAQSLEGIHLGYDVDSCVIEGNDIHNNQGSGIVAWPGPGSTGPLEVVGNRLTENRVGLSLHLPESTFSIRDNVIADNTEDGLALYAIFYSSDQCPILDGNTLTRNVNGLRLEDIRIDCAMSNAVLHSNTGYDVLVGQFTTNFVTFKISDSWWGTADLAAIEANIHDYDDDYHIGDVVYLPILLSEEGSANSPPVVSVTATPQTGLAPLDVVFEFSAVDPDGAGIYSYEWDFDGDGVFDLTSGAGGTETVSYTGSGAYRAQLRVTDKDGLAATHTMLIAVTDTGDSMELCGRIDSDLHLPPDVTVHVSCDLVVAPGVTLTVNSGVRLEFASGTKLVANGTLVITGNELAPVVLTSDSATPAAGDWNGIQVRGEDLDRIEYASISYATKGIDVIDGSLELRNSEVARSLEGIHLGYYVDSFVIEGNDIHNNQGSGIVAWPRSGSTGPLEVVGNRLTENWVGLHLELPGSTVSIRDNVIADNTTDGLALWGLSYSSEQCPELDGNTLTGNVNGLRLDYVRVDCAMSNAVLHSNTGYDVLVEDDHSRFATFTIRDSWWGTTDLAAIEANIHDYDDDYDIGDVVYSRILLSEGGSANSPPVVSVTATPQTGLAPLKVDFEFSAVDPDGGGIDSYEWDFDGDGVFEIAFDVGSTVAVSYPISGTYSAQLRVTDENGLAATRTMLIAVADTGDSLDLCGRIDSDLYLPQEVTVHVSCDLEVLPGVTLTVAAGARLEFASGTKLVANGALKITGTESAPVILTSDSATPAAGDWNGIQVRGEDLDSIEYASISYATTGVDVVDGSLELRNSEVASSIRGVCLDYDVDSCVIEGNDIHNNRGSGVFARPGWGSTGPFEVVGNRLTENRVGLHLELPGLTVSIRDNVIADNTTDGLALWGLFYSSEQCPELDGNTLTGNVNGLRLDDVRVDCAMSNAVLHSNTGYDVLVEDDYSRLATFTIMDSWWGTTDLAAIEANIHDYDDDYDIGDVVYDVVEAPQCGNGTVEAGETCDGDCPVECVDEEVCTRDEMSGDASTCDARCSFVSIVACISGDGCCPDGCYAAVDSDCTH